MKKTLMTVGLLAALTASSTFAAGVVTTYSTLAGWQAAVGNQSLETFTNTTQAFTTFNLVGATPDSYLGSAAQFYGIGTNQPTNGPTPSHAFINNGVWQDVVDNNAGSCNCALSTSLSYNNGTGIYGISGTFSTLSAGAGQGLSAVLRYADNSTATVTLGAGFNGFVSSTAFTSLVISSAGQNLGSGAIQETYTLDDLRFGTTQAGEVVTPPSGVPEPATFSMMGLALVGLGVVARKRRS